MTTVRVLDPLGAFYGRSRLLDLLQASLADSAYDEFLTATAFASSAPLQHLATGLTQFRANGGTARALIGIDHLGTSLEALQEALRLFEDVFIVHTTASTCIFHPKVYIFRGKRHARCFVGSNNLTTGGTQTNLEAAVDISFDLPPDDRDFAPFLALWHGLLPPCPLTRVLTPTLLTQLAAYGLVLPEGRSANSITRDSTAPSQGAVSPAGALGFSTEFPAAPRALPRPASKSGRGRGSKPSATRITQVVRSEIIARTLVMQVRVQHNGEMYLSKQALDQNPAFFDWPWTGRTKPKKAKNAAGEQRDPDFVVNITVYDATGAEIVNEVRFALNTIYYAKRHEVRVTVSSRVRDAVQDMSILMMTVNHSLPNVDYEMRIFNPGSAAYGSFLAQCNQRMPSGGRKLGRRMGWL